MLTYDAAIHAADRAAGAVWKGCQGPQAFGWRDGFHVRAAISLAQFVTANRAAPARDLYRFATAGLERPAQPFERVPAVLRVSIETFRATFLVLLQELERSSLAPSVAQCQPARGHMPDRVSEVPGAMPGLPPGHPKGPLDENIRRLEETWTRDDGRPAKRQAKAPDASTRRLALGNRRGH